MATVEIDVEHISYPKKCGFFTNGVLDKKIPDRVPLRSTVSSATFSFLGILAVSLIQHNTPFYAVIGSFGASAVLIYDAFDSPLAQPRNLIGGHLISAVVGVSCYKLIGHLPYIANACAVSFAIVVMDRTQTLHPPGGATALIAVVGPEHIHHLGYWYVLYPVMLGAFVLLGIALLLNNIDNSRRYPLWWI